MPWEGKDPGAREDLFSASCFIHTLSAASVRSGGIQIRCLAAKNDNEKWKELPKISLSLGKNKKSWHQGEAGIWLLKISLSLGQIKRIHGTRERLDEDKTSQFVLLVKLKAEKAVKNILKIKLILLNL